MDNIMVSLASLLAPLTSSNLAIFLLAGLIALLLVALIGLPSLERMLASSQVGGSGARRIDRRLIRQMQAVRPSGGRKMTDLVSERLFRGGSGNDRILTDGDFFLFVRVIFGAAFAIFGTLLFLLLTDHSPFFLLLAGVGYFLPSALAWYHNRSRTKQILKALPRALPKMAVRIQTDELDRAFERLAEQGTGPLYSEFAWVGRQLRLASNTNPWNVLREVDRRNPGLYFFGGLADEAEREARGSPSRARSVIIEIIIGAMNDHYAKVNEKIGGVANKATVAFAPFLLIAFLAAAIAPALIQALGAR